MGSGKPAVCGSIFYHFSLALNLRVFSVFESEFFWRARFGTRTTPPPGGVVPNFWWNAKKSKSIFPDQQFRPNGEESVWMWEGMGLSPSSLRKRNASPKEGLSLRTLFFNVFLGWGRSHFSVFLLPFLSMILCFRHSNFVRYEFSHKNLKFCLTRLKFCHTKIPYDRMEILCSVRFLR